MKNGSSFSRSNAKRKDTPLHLAAKTGDKDTVNRLLKQGADLYATNAMGRTPMHSAVAGKKQDMVELILTKGFDPERRFTLFVNDPIENLSEKRATLDLLQFANKYAENSPSQTRKDISWLIADWPGKQPSKSQNASSSCLPCIPRVGSFLTRLLSSRSDSGKEYLIPPSAPSR